VRIKYLWSSRHTRVLKSGNKHRKSVPKVVGGMIKICDVVLEVLDARYIDETRNKEVEENIKEQRKKLIFVINKCDLVEVDKLKEEAERKKLFPHVIISCKSGIGKGGLIERIKIEAKRALSEKKFEIAHVGILGYPNTGKSSLINFLTGRNATTTSSTAGFTKGMKKIRLSSGVLLLDTPGIIPSKEDTKYDREVLEKHAKIDVEPYDRVKEPEFVVDRIIKQNPEKLEKFYGVEADGDSEILIDELGKRKKLFAKGGVVDSDRTARAIIKDWQDGKIK
jgi:ribosome biogenesis GTPase A